MKIKAWTTYSVHKHVLEPDVCCYEKSAVMPQSANSRVKDIAECLGIDGQSPPSIPRAPCYGLEVRRKLCSVLMSFACITVPVVKAHFVLPV